MKTTYNVKEAAKMIGLSEKEVYEAIEARLLPASLQDNEMVVPEWGVRVYLRTIKALKKLENKESLREGDALLKALLGKVEVILESLENNKVVEVLLNKNEELLNRIGDLERIIKDQELERERLRSFYEAALIKKEVELRASFEAEIESLKQQLARVEYAAIGKEENFYGQLQGKDYHRKQGFWQRFIRMLTWE